MLCHHYRCIFVHIPKCGGGTSIEHIFLNLVGLDWRRRAPLLLRPNRNPDLGPPRLSHLSAREYVEYKYVLPVLFSQYFKFSFVRNPWSRAVSLFHSIAYHRHPDFRAFLAALRSGDELKRRWFCEPQVDYLLDENGDPMVDFIGRLESMSDDFSFIADKLRLGEIDVPHKNRNRKIAREFVDGDRCISNYTDFYDEETKAMVSDYYRRDIELLGYDFGD